MFVLDAHKYIHEYASRCDLAAITAARQQGLAPLSKFQKLADLVEALPTFACRHVDFRHDVAAVGAADEINDQMRSQLHSTLMALRPWKKGPYSLFGIDIDAEWRSDFKWSRILNQRPHLKGARIADIGCNNGYYMYRMATHDPALVIGFEPMPLHLLEFEVFQRYAQVPQLQFEPLGVEHLGFFPEFFDTIFCLGILYHHTDPVAILRNIFRSLVAGGEVFIDCQGISDPRPIALVPGTRYAGAAGIWNLPSRSCLINWLHRSGFRDIECFFEAPLTTSEQRATEWAPLKSLADFLDPTDPTKTIEGHPAPVRIYVRARK